MNIANILTIVRILLLPIFILSFETNRTLAGIIFIASMITDALDGYIARKKNIKTKFGTIIDPVADKLFLISSFILLCIHKDLSTIYLYIVMFREVIIITGWIIIYLSVSYIMPSSISGKLTVLFQTITIFLFIFKLQKAGILISYFMVAITIFSTIHYIFLGVEKIKELK